MSIAPLIAITGVTRGLGRVLADWFSDQGKGLPVAQSSPLLRRQVGH